MTSINQTLANGFTTLTANLSRLSETEKLVVVGYLKQLEDELTAALTVSDNLTDLTKRRYEALINQNKKTIKTAYTNINNQSANYLSGVGKATTGGASAIFNSVGLPLQSVAITTEQYMSLATNTMIQGAPNAAWWANQSKDLQDKFMQQMRMGYTAGETNAQLINRVRGSYTGTKNFVIDGVLEKRKVYTGGIMDASYNQARSLVTTATNQISSDARRLLYNENADILKGIVQVSTLDYRTTLQCAARDGKAWTLDGKPIGHTIAYDGGTPLHWGCRSIEVPMTKSWTELGADKKIDQKYLQDIDSATRASMDGQVPMSETFDSWIRGKSEADQIAYFGPKKYKLWKDGSLSLRQMIDQQGNPLTINQLARAYGFQIEDSMRIGQPAIPVVQQNAITLELEAQKRATEINSQIVGMVDVAEEAIKTLKGNLPARGSIVLLGAHAYDLSVIKDLIAFKKRKAQLLEGYRSAVAAGKRPTVLERQMYEGLAGLEKELFDDSVAYAQIRTK